MAWTAGYLVGSCSGTTTRRDLLQTQGWAEEFPGVQGSGKVALRFAEQFAKSDRNDQPAKARTSRSGRRRKAHRPPGPGAQETQTSKFRLLQPAAQTVPH